MERTISAAQFFGMAFVSRAAITIALNAGEAAGGSLLGGILSYLLAMAAGFVIALPVWLLHRRQPETPISRQAVEALGGLGKLLPLFYLLYFWVMNGVSLGLFQLFLLDNVNPDFPAFLILAALVAVAAYGAWRGLETVARAAACVLALVLLGTALVFALVARRFDGQNLTPLLSSGAGQLLKGAGLFLSRTSLFAEMALLLPYVRGRKALGFAAWAGGTALFVGLLLLLMAGCLGPYAYTQNFPVFTLASLTETSSMQRLDAVFTGVWMMGLVIQAASGLYCCRVCAASLGKPRPGAAVAVSGGAMLLLGVGTASSLALQTVLMDARLWLALTLLAGALLPLLLWALCALRRKGGERP